MPVINSSADRAAMRIESYEELISRFELYEHITEGMDDIISGNTRLFSEAMSLSSKVCKFL